jgi:ABC-2 type transport system permease protein
MFTRSIAIFEKTLKELIRDKATLFWTIAWPAIWLLLSSTMFTTRTLEAVLPQLKGVITISMVGLALMTTGMVNLAGSIAGDRERGTYLKFASTPLKAWEDALGRLGGLLTFAFIGSLLVLVIGFALGAVFQGSAIDVLQCVGYALLILLASGGIGITLGCIVTSESSATHIGVGITVITATISGIFAPYSALPEVLQRFSEMYPPSSLLSSITYILAGETYAGYNPLTPEHATYTIISSLAIFIVGLMVYRQKLWIRRL